MEQFSWNPGNKVETRSRLIGGDIDNDLDVFGFF